MPKPQGRGLTLGPLAKKLLGIFSNYLLELQTRTWGSQKTIDRKSQSGRLLAMRVKKPSLIHTRIIEKKNQTEKGIDFDFQV